MWASIPATSLIPSPSSSTPRPTPTKPNHVFFVSSKFQQPQNNNYDDVEEETGQKQQVPRGSDILKALQRATEKKKLRRIPDSRAKTDTISTRANTSIITVDSDVKPLRIKSDWSTRLDELELRLQELLHI